MIKKDRRLIEGKVETVYLSTRLLASVLSFSALAVPICHGQENTPINGSIVATDNREGATPTFEVASIRPSSPDTMIQGVRMQFVADGYDAKNVTLQLLIESAYGVDENQIAGLPKWANSERYQIAARIDEMTSDAITKLSDGPRRVVQQHMLQELLTDRFKLLLHHETKQLSVYLLVPAKTGVRLHDAKAGNAYSGLPVGMLSVDFAEGRLVGHEVPISQLVQLMTPELGRHILDQTGLTGKYDFTLRCSPSEMRALMDGGTWTPDSGGPSIFTALQEQLGLELKSQKAPIEALVIDHVEKPSAN